MLRAVRPILPVLLLAAACSTDAPTAPGRTAAPTTPPPDPVTVCTDQITYWAGQDLTGTADGSFDYQHRGLTSEQNDALGALVEQARAASWSPEQLAEQARTACGAIVAEQPGGY